MRGYGFAEPSSPPAAGEGGKKNQDLEKRETGTKTRFPGWTGSAGPSAAVKQTGPKARTVRQPQCRPNWSFVLLSMEFVYPAIPVYFTSETYSSSLSKSSNVRGVKYSKRLFAIVSRETSIQCPCGKRQCFHIRRIPDGFLRDHR